MKTRQRLERTSLSSFIVCLLCLGAFSDALALQWESIGPSGGRVDGFAQSRANPNRMYVLFYSQGVWRSDDRGAHWNRVDVGLDSGQSYVSVAASSFAPELVIIAPNAGNAILRSTDGGVEWTSVFVANGLGEIQDIEFDPLSARNVLLTASGSGSVYKSTDAGETWSLSNSGFTGGPVQIAFHPLTSGTILVGSSTGVFRTTNAGSSWIPANMGGNASARHLSICRTQPSRVWALGFPEPLIRSDDGGVNFVSAQAPAFPDYSGWMEVAANPENSNHVLAAFNDFFCGGDCMEFAFVVRSTNAGASWNNYFAPSADHSWSEFVTGFDFDVEDESIAYFSLGDGYGSVPVGFLRTTDQGQTWAPWMSGLAGRSIGKVDHDGTGKVYARASGLDGLWSASTAGGDWIELPPQFLSSYSWYDLRVNRGVLGLLDQLGVSYSFDTGEAIYRRSTDGGLSWHVSSGLPFDGGDEFIPFASATAMVSDQIDGQTVYVWLDFMIDNEVCKSTDGGATFQIAHVGISAVDAEIDPANPERVYSIEGWPNGQVHMTTDGGTSWTLRSNGLPNSPAVELLIDPTNADRLAAVYRTAGVFETQNAGLTWTPVALPGYGGQALIDADWDPNSNRYFLAIENAGVYVNGIGMISDGLVSAPTSITYEPVSGKVLLGTFSASVDLLDVGSAVAAPFDTTPPQLDIAIHARPNPSRGQFDFDVDVAKDAEARISIVDVRGRRVAVAFQGRLDQGRHSIHWKGELESGEPVVPGIYFARINAAGQTATTRLVILGQ
jgi:photosystem II stability/assembly factor-like uncharacterized protein